MIINFALGTVEPSSVEFNSADLNGDGVIDILDIVNVINIILD